MSPFFYVNSFVKIANIKSQFVFGALSCSYFVLNFWYENYDYYFILFGYHSVCN